MKANKATAEELLDKGSDFYDKGKWNPALECWERANGIYEELEDKQGISLALNSIGNIYKNRGEWERALENYNKSLAISKELEDTQGISYALNNIGLIYQNRGEWERALENYNKSLAISKELEDTQGISYTLNNIGLIYQNRGEWERALKNYNKSLAISKELEDTQGISYALGNIGLIYQNRGEWERALKNYNKSLAISKELEDTQRSSYTLNNIGLIYQNRGEWERALENYNKSLAISKEHEDKQGISSALNNIGLIYQNRGEWERALENYNKSLAISKELEDKQGISYALGNIGNIYQNRGEWERALENYNKSLAISKEHEDKQGISCALNNICEINIKKGDLEEAKINLEKSLTIAEELAPISTVDALANLSELLRLDDRYDDAFATLETALQIVIDVGARSKEIDILAILANTDISKYIADKEEENLSSSEEFYKKALELAISLKMPLQKAIAIRGIGIVQAKKEDMPASKKSFKESIETLHSLGAIFELQKTALEYARALYENNDIVEANIVAKSAAFDALRNAYREPLVKTYLLLGDIAMSQENQYGYYLDCLKQAEFNPKIYVKTCFFLIYRMKKMEKQVLLRFISSLKEINKDKSFNNFLNALNARIAGKEYDTAGLPSSLVEEIESFRR